MKRIIMVCAVIASFLSVRAAPSDSVVWVQQQSGVHTTLWSVMFVDTMHGWACGDAGVLLRTADGGAHWQKSVAFSSRSISALCFINPATGWAVTDTAQIYKSTDSGATWSLQFSTPRAFFSDCVFLDSSTGFAGGSAMSGANMYNEGIIYTTVNGGTTWTLGWSSLISIWTIGSFSFPDSRHGWATGADYLMKTTNAGLAWQTPVDFTAITDSSFVKTGGYINTVYFKDTLNGFAIGRNGHVLRTRDGGASWKLVANAPWPEGVAFADAGHGVIAGERGAVLTSSDSGALWTLRYPRQLPFIDAPWFRDVVLLDVNHGWLAGDSGIIMKGRFYTPSTGIPAVWRSAETAEQFTISSYSRFEMTVAYTVTAPGTVCIDLRDMEGRIVMDLAAGPRSAGAHSETCSLNRSIKSGMYIVTLRGRNLVSCIKTVIIR